jgi:hypothetical protein
MVGCAQILSRCYMKIVLTGFVLLAALFGCRSPYAHPQSGVTVVSVYPRPGEKKVSNFAVLSITFSKPLSLHKDAFRVYLLGQRTQSIVPGFIYPSRDMMTYSFVPTYPYKKGERYCAVLRGYPPLYFYGNDSLVWDFQIERKGVFEWFSSLWEKEEPPPRFYFHGGPLQEVPGNVEGPHSFRPY